MGFDHYAVLYRDTDEFLAQTVPFVLDGVAAGEPVMVALPPQRAEQLRDRLGGLADGVEFVDMVGLGINPARIIPAWHDFIERNGGPGASLRGIGEPAWPGRSEDEFHECERHESLLNHAFSHAEGFRLMCPYDVGGLPPEVVDGARRTHPVVAEHGLPLASGDYEPPGTATGPFDGDLPPAPTDADRIAFDIDSLSEVRRLVDANARTAGFPDVQATDLVIAVTELATNAVRHGGGGGIVRLWHESGALICEVQGGGRLEDPLAGRRRPSVLDEGGWGLWLVNHLCDLAQVRSGPAGTTVRVRLRPALAAAA